MASIYEKSLSVHIRALNKNFLTSTTLFCVVGFACIQAFMFSLFYMGTNISLGGEWFAFEQADFLLTLLSMVLAFALLRAASERARNALLSSSLLWCYAVLLILGSFISSFFPSDTAAVIVEGVLVGFPAALLLVAWGRAFGRQGVEVLVQEVFLAGALAALICLMLLIVPAVYSEVLVALLALGSVFCLQRLSSFTNEVNEVDFPHQGRVSMEPSVSLSFGDLVATGDQHDKTTRLSHKIMMGTCLFGLTAGFIGIYMSDPGMASVPTFSASLILLVLFCIAALQLLSGKRNLESQESLDGVYRLAILVMMAGFLFVPVLESYGVTGEAIVLTGYLGLIFVLMSLFLVTARLTRQDAAFSFARGFSMLYCGQIAGIIFGSIMEAFGPSGQVPYIVASCAGLTALFAYLFLFTERDFRELSVIVEQADRFEDACHAISQTYALSKREAEILPLALRGRTGERIAAEFYISKSTVETHLRRIYVKTGVHGRQELIDLGESTIQGLLKP